MAAYDCDCQNTSTIAVSGSQYRSARATCFCHRSRRAHYAFSGPPLWAGLQSVANFPLGRCKTAASQNAAIVEVRRNGEGTEESTIR